MMTQSHESLHSMHVELVQDDTAYIYAHILQTIRGNDTIDFFCVLHFAHHSHFATSDMSHTR